MKEPTNNKSRMDRNLSVRSKRIKQLVELKKFEDNYKSKNQKNER